ncbi:MAG: DUF4956 domain-containing protein [Bacteroidota bacterium]
MLEQYFSNSGYFEFPSFSVAVFTILLAVVLSTILALTYKFTYREDNFPNKFFQAIVLASIVSSMVMMAVGDNLAVGFGVLGAVSIIRFRTLLRSPRNIIFIFMSLSIGIATGVFGYAIAISGTILFCVIVTLLYYSPYGKMSPNKIELDVIATNTESLQNLITHLKNNSFNFSVVRIREQENGNTRYTIEVNLPPDTNSTLFFKSIQNIDGLTDIRYDSRDNVEQL